MATPLPYSTRLHIVHHKLAGLSLPCIAFCLLISLSSARKYHRRFLRSGEAGLLLPRKPIPSPSLPLFGILSRFNPTFKDIILAIKVSRPTWGAARILRELSNKTSLNGLRFPSSRTVQRFLSANKKIWMSEKQFQPPEGWLPTFGAHVEWQLDMKEEVQFKDIGKITFIEIYDIGSGLFIASLPIKVSDSIMERGRPVNWKEVRAALRKAFEIWGMPERVRTDRGAQFVGSEKNTLPSLFSMWLWGLGIEHRLPEKGYSPQLNGGVERMHQTLEKRVMIGAEYKTIEEIEKGIEEEITNLNENEKRKARGCKGKIPLKSHPEWRHSGREYKKENEIQMFKEKLIWAQLEEKIVERKVGKTGTVSINDRGYSVGKKYAGKQINVKINASTKEYVFTEEGVEVKRIKIKENHIEKLCMEEAPESRRRSHGKKAD